VALFRIHPWSCCSNFIAFHLNYCTKFRGVIICGTWCRFYVKFNSVKETQGDQLSGKPGTVGDFDSCQWNVGDFTKSQGIVWEKILSGNYNSCLKLFIVSCIFASILDFTECISLWFRIMHCYIPIPTTDNNTGMSNTYHGQECRKPSGKCHGISHCLESGHPATSNLPLSTCPVQRQVAAIGKVPQLCYPILANSFDVKFRKHCDTLLFKKKLTFLSYFLKIFNVSSLHINYLAPVTASKSLFLVICVCNFVCWNHATKFTSVSTLQWALRNVCCA